MRNHLLTLGTKKARSRSETLPSPSTLRVLLLVSSFNGLSQRVWCALREEGHEVAVEFATTPEAIAAAAQRIDPDLILCPFLKERVPAAVWRTWRTVIIHPGPVGDRGPSSLDWAITDGARLWGVTALQAVEEMDAGPVWATRTFPLPADPPRKSDLYHGPVTEAAMACVDEVLAKALDPEFQPTPAERLPRPVPSATVRPLMRQPDRAFSWSDDAASIVRAIRAADGAPGVRTEIAGVPVWAFDAHPGPRHNDPPGTVLAVRGRAVLVAAGHGSVWVGHARAVPASPEERTVKLPAALVLADHLPPDLPTLGTTPTPDSCAATDSCGPGHIHYVRRGDVGYVVLDVYNGALSADDCDQLLYVLRHAARQDTRVLVLRGGSGPFCNGIHLNVIHAAPNPAREAWANITAINDVCRELITCRGQVTIAAFTGNAGAGGVMLALGADLVLARAGVVLNPFYEMGLTGSELHTYTLPRRVGDQVAQRLLRERLPVSATDAHRLGLVDDVGPGDPEVFTGWLHDTATRYRDPQLGGRLLARKSAVLNRDLGTMPLDAYEARELGEMAYDMFDDRKGFAAARAAFVHKVRPDRTPARLTALRDAR